MADLSLVFDLLARDKASPVFDKVGDSARKAGEGGSRFGKLITTGIGVATGALIGAGLIDTMKGFYDAAADSARIGRLTNQVLKSTGGVANVTATQVGNLATALSNKTGMDDEDIQSAENLLLTFTNVRNEAGKGNDVFNRTSAAALDMSAALGTSASGAAMQLGKALNNPIKGVSALGRAGVTFTKAQKDQIKTLVDSGKTLDAQKIILGEVSKEFGGAAAAAATPWDRFQVTLGNLQETIGGALIPVFSTLAGGAMQVINVLFGNPPTGGPFTPNSIVVRGLQAIRGAFITVSNVVKGFIGAFTGQGSDALNNFSGPVMDRIINAAATARNVWNTLSAFFTGTLLPALRTVAGFITGTVLPAVGGLFGFLLDHQQAVVIVAGIITAVFLPALISMGVQSLIAGAKTVAGWVMGNAAAIAGAAMQSVAVVRTVAGWVLMGAQSLLQAARMAAAWVIAMGPIGWVIAAVIGIVALIVANWGRIRAATAAAWNAVVAGVKAAWTWIKAVVGEGLRIITVWFLNFTGPGLIIHHWTAIVNFTRTAWAKVTGAVSTAWTAVRTAISNGISAAVTFVSALPGRIVGALGNAGRWLWGVGTSMIQGLINGAGSLLRNIGRMFLNIVPGFIRGPFEHALGIGSPSKIFHQYGINIGQGLINGLTGSQKTVTATATKLGKQLVAAYHKAAKIGDRGTMRATTAAYAVLRSGDDALEQIAKRREIIAGRLKAAQGKLADALKVRNDYAASIRDAAAQTANITQDVGTATTSGTLIDRMRTQLAAIRTFRTDLAKLSGMGLSNTLYKQIADAGVEQGGATAQALLSGGKGAVTQVNTLSKSIQAASAGLGTDTSKKLYQAGVDAATGLVRGLTAQSTALTRAADTLAARLTAAIKAKLGIRSPSTVFQGVGVSIGQGLADGIASMQPTVAAELAALTPTATPALGYRPPGYDLPAAAAGGGGGATYVTTVSGVASPEAVAAQVVRAQRTNEFLAGVGT